MLRIKRVYEEASKEDGYRVLVDRLWPRGISKEKAHIDLWLKEIAPSNELRKWFGHDPEKWQEFKTKYKKELNENEDALKELVSLIKKHSHMTLLYGAKDTEHNQALVLHELLTKHK